MDGSELIGKLMENTKRFRQGMKDAGFTLKVCTQLGKGGRQ